MATPRATFQPTITASTWANTWGTTFERAQAKYGKAFAADGTLAPTLSMADLASLVRAWHTAAPATFPLWSQWAALAYDWDPQNPARFATGAAQAKRRMDVETARDFWVSTQKLALDLDDGAMSPRLSVEAGTFGDPLWLAMVKADLLSDGAKVEWEIPVGCRDPKTGKAKPPHLGCKEGWTLTQVSPGAFMCVNDATGERKAPERICEGEPVVVKDPVSAAKQTFVKALLILGALWWFSKQGNR